jgi:hypothetical protein
MDTPRIGGVDESLPAVRFDVEGPRQLPVPGLGPRAESERPASRLALLLETLRGGVKMGHDGYSPGLGLVLGGLRGGEGHHRLSRRSGQVGAGPPDGPRHGDDRVECRGEGPFGSGDGDGGREGPGAESTAERAGPGRAGSGSGADAGRVSCRRSPLPWAATTDDQPIMGGRQGPGRTAPSRPAPHRREEQQVPRTRTKKKPGREWEKFYSIAVLEHHQMEKPQFNCYDTARRLDRVWTQLREETDRLAITPDRGCILRINEKVARALNAQPGAFRDVDGWSRLVLSVAQAGEAPLDALPAEDEWPAIFAEYREILDDEHTFSWFLSALYWDHLTRHRLPTAWLFVNALRVQHGYPEYRLEVDDLGPFLNGLSGSGPPIFDGQTFYPGQYST